MTIQSTKKKPKRNLCHNVWKLLNVTDKNLEGALKELGVNPAALPDILAGIREWFEKQPHLPQGDLDDEVITRRLITQGFSIERVKEKLDNYYTMRHKMPEILCGRDPFSPAVSKCLKQGYWYPLPKKTADNKRVTIFRSQNTSDPLTEIIKIAFMIGDYRLWNDDATGDYWVFDFKHATLNHAMQFNPVLITKIMFYLNYCYGPKVVAQYLVNLPPFASAIVSLFKKSMKKKMVERLYVYDSFEELFTVLPRNIFPKDYGGGEVCCQDIADEWKKTFQLPPMREYFLEQEHVKSDESKRQQPTKANELFGAAGSFKKLEFD